MYNGVKKEITDYQYYLFDADGTLIDTEELIYQSYKETIKRCSLPEIPRERMQVEIGKPLKSNLEAFLGKRDKDELERISREHIAYQFSIAHKYLRLFSGVKEVLSSLKSRGKNLAIVTSRSSETLLEYFRQLEIFPFFDFFITPEMTKNHKPHPEPVLKAMKLLNAKPADCLFVGDTQYDYESAARAGVKFCFVTWSFTKYTELQPAPDYFAAHMSEFL